MTLEEFIKHNKGILKQINGGEEVLNYLEELKDLREKYKNVSEAFIKVNNSVFDTKMELNKVKQELENAKNVAEFQQKSNIERGFRVKALKEELRVYKKAFELACDDIRTLCNSDCGRCPLYEDCKSSNNDVWELDYLQKAREEQ